MAAALGIAYFGSRGSFSEEAARTYAQRLGRAAEPRGAEEAGAVLALLEDGAVELAVLPIANSCGGLVWAALAALGKRELELVDEVVLAVRFTLCARPGLALAALERVASHPQALRQCARTLARLLPHAEHVAASDTASAARDLAAGRLGERAGVLCSAAAGELHGLVALARDLQDEPDNRTFFAVLRRAPRGAVD